MSSLVAAADPSTRQALLDSMNTVRAESTSAPPPKKIEIHTLGWYEDHPAEAGEAPSITIYSRVFIDGVEVPQLSSVETKHSGSEFSEVTLRIYGPVEVITHDRDSWAKL